MKLTRRSALRGVGAATLAAWAGCLSAPGDDDDSDGDGESPDNGDYEGYGAFFAVYDWASEIGGDRFQFENPVQTGEMGHGWEPDSGLQRDIAETDAFVYLDTPEFSWAQNIAGNLEEEDVDTEIIDGFEGFSEDQLLPFSSDTQAPADESAFDPDSLEIAEFDIINRNTGDVGAYLHGDHWHGELPPIPLEGTITLEGHFEDEDGRVIPLGGDSSFEFDVGFGPGADEDVIEIESRGDHVVIHGNEEGSVFVVFELRYDGELLWDTSVAPKEAEVVAELDETAVDETFDPHVWTDPVLAQDIVETIADGLGEIDPDNADLYEENAEDYIGRLEAVDEQFEELVENAQRDIAIFAGHDSFQYIEHRYGFELYSPVGVSPNDSPSIDDIAQTIELVDEEGIDTILFDPFETPDPDNDVPDLAQQIIESSSATETAPITPAEGTTQEWEENGWGWVEQMEEVTIPSLAKALGAE